MHEHIKGGLLALASGLAAVGVNAQDQAGGLEEVVVTAERREASLQTVPIAVSALSEETLRNRDVTQSQDLQRFVPSLKMMNNITTPTNLSPSLRGSTVQDASLIVAESPFGIYVDDVYVGRLNGNNVTLADIERVEVLRGPQGTLYGRNTLAGAIKFISREPGDESWLRASAGLGNFDQYLGSVSVGGPISSSWSGSFAAQINNLDNQYHNAVTGQDTGHEQNWATRAKLRYTGGDALDATLSFSYANGENDSLQLVPRVTPGVPANQQFSDKDLVPRTIPSLPGVTLGFYDVATPSITPAPAPITSPPSGETEQTIASLNVSYDFGGVTLRSITGFVKTEDFFSTDFTGYGAILGASTVDDDQFTQELQLLGNWGDRADYLFGVFYLKQDGSQDFGWRLGIPFTTSQIEATTESYSAFGQVNFNLTEALRATVGLRYTKDEKSFDMAQQYLFAPLPPDSVSLDNSYDAWTPKFALDYTVASGGAIDSMMLYVSAARGFKSGGYNGIAIANLNDARSPYFPETNWTYEGGIKTDLLDRRLRINAAYFYNDITDLQLNATVDTGGVLSFPVQNAGEATIQGLEFEISAIPLEGLTVFLNGALLDGKYGNLNPGSAPAQAPVLYGVQPQVPQVPDYSFTLGFDYGHDIPLGSAGGRINFGADWFRTDDYVSAATNDFLVTAYDRFTGYVGLGIGDNWDLRFAVKNIADDDKITSGSRALGGFITLRPRTYMFTVNYSVN